MQPFLAHGHLGGLMINRIVGYLDHTDKDWDWIFRRIRERLDSGELVKVPMEEVERELDRRTDD